MASHNSLDKVTLIAALHRDVLTTLGAVLNAREIELDIQKISRRISAEGDGFLTKTLPKLGKALDKGLACVTTFNCFDLRLESLSSSQLPKLFGELFKRVFHSDGTVLPEPCIASIRHLRLVCYLFYKYELPYSKSEEQTVIQSFERTEDELIATDNYLELLQKTVDRFATVRDQALTRLDHILVVRRARRLLSRLFANYSFTDIRPRNGPGAVAEKLPPWSKFRFQNIPDRITNLWPWDAYFCASLGHVCDTYKDSPYTNHEPSARVILVPKDSRGPRLISAEPLVFQWIQQGIMRTLVPHIEHHPLTRYNVHFTNQNPNQNGALLGSIHGHYSTLDMKDASDRISVQLVKLLFPEHVCEYLLAARSLTTQLPDGRTITLRKFAPMGSALCFPILALTVWSILTASAPDKYTRERILVYGDDIVVPTAFAEDTMNILESFGLKINRDKSCFKGFFRESCGVDAYKGSNVTPVRLRTVWSVTQSPDSFVSWVSYANSLYKRGYYQAYDYIVGCLHRLYGCIAGPKQVNSPVRLVDVPDHPGPPVRLNKSLQRLEYKCLEVQSKSVKKVLPGWEMLLRFFSERSSSGEPSHASPFPGSFDPEIGLSVSSYTKRCASILVRRWR